MKKIIAYTAIIIASIMILIGIFVFIGCNSPVKYEAHTDYVKCNIAIMLATMKSKEGYSALEVSAYVNGCFSEIDRQACKKDHFGDQSITYDRKDDRYINYLSCLTDKK